jgi:hypothetical protein
VSQGAGGRESARRGLGTAPHQQAVASGEGAEGLLRVDRAGQLASTKGRGSQPGFAPRRDRLGGPSAAGCDAFRPAIAALGARLGSTGRLKPKQIALAAMRKLLVLCFGVLKTGAEVDPRIAMPA